MRIVLKLKFFCKAAKFYEVVNFLVYSFNCLGSVLVNFCNFFQCLFKFVGGNLIMFSNLCIFGAKTLQKRSFIFEQNIVRKSNFKLLRYFHDLKLLLLI